MTPVILPIYWETRGGRKRVTPSRTGPKDPPNALKDLEGTVSNGGRTVTNFRFANDIGSLVGVEEELAKLFERLDKASIAYSMGISTEKTRLMTNNTSGINKEIKVNGQKFEAVTNFKYLGSIVSDEG